MKIPQRIDAATPKAVMRDGAFGAGHDGRLHEQTSAFAINACGNSSHHVFTTPRDAPTAVVTAMATWVPFQILNGIAGTGTAAPFDVPHHHQKQQGAIAAKIKVMLSNFHSVKLRLQVVTLVDVVATSSGEGRVVQGWDSQSMTYWDWLNSDDRIRKSATTTVRVESPTMPANRRVALRLQARMDGRTATYLAKGGETRIFIESVRFYDEPDQDTYG